MVIPHAAALANLANLAKNRIVQSGFSVTVNPDIDQFEQNMISVSGKGLHPMLSPRMQTFTQDEVLTLSVMDGDTFVGGVAACRVSLGDRSLAEHWMYSYKRLYQAKAETPIASTCGFAKSIRGTLVYEGQLFVREEYRRGRLSSAALLHLLHSYAGLQWDPDWIYAFIRNTQSYQVAKFGFSTWHLGAQKWSVLGANRNPDEGLVTLSRDDLRELCLHYEQFPDHFCPGGKQGNE
jgi:hypothetical protein